MVGAMGIRYFAVSIDTEDYEHIKAGPCPTCGTRPHPRDTDDCEQQTDTLDLDKSWRYLQHFLAETRPARQLVSGQVTNTNYGWISYQGLVSPDEVPAVAADLKSITSLALEQHFKREGDWINDRSEEDFRYVSAYLDYAIAFTEKVANDARGIVYYIG